MTTTDDDNEFAQAPTEYHLYAAQMLIKDVGSRIHALESHIRPSDASGRDDDFCLILNELHTLCEAQQLLIEHLLATKKEGLHE